MNLKCERISSQPTADQALTLFVCVCVQHSCIPILPSVSIYLSIPGSSLGTPITSKALRMCVCTCWE